MICARSELTRASWASRCAWMLCGWVCLAGASGCSGHITQSPAANGGTSGSGTGGSGANVNSPSRGGADGTARAGAGGAGSAGHAGASSVDTRTSGQLSQGGRAGSEPAGAGGSAGTASPGDLVNPAPGSSFFMGVNFWNIEWEGSENYFQDNVSWSATDNPWNVQFLMDLAPYHVLRFMDWNLINESDNPQATWDTRTQAKSKQGEPVAYEWQIDLCNRSMKDYWINIPHAADGDYVSKLATLIHDKLDPKLRVYVEWSNEVWNGSFPQREYAQSQGEALGLSGDDKAASYLVYQSVRAFEAFDTVFGADSPRVVKVIAGQAAWTGPCEAQLAALQDKKINPKGTKPTVFAIAPYFYGESVDELSKGIEETKGWVADNVKCAQGAGLPVIAYEGGQDSYSLGEDGCAELQRDAGMRAVYGAFLDALSDAKLKGPFMHYTHSGNCWGLKRRTSDSSSDSPKYQGMLDWLSKH